MPRRKVLKYRIINPFTEDDSVALKAAMEKVIRRMTPRRHNEFVDSLQDDVERREPAGTPEDSIKTSLRKSE
jgi:hypothetical protein